MEENSMCFDEAQDATAAWRAKRFCCPYFSVLFNSFSRLMFFLACDKMSQVNFAAIGELIRIWTRGQILPQKSKFSELPQNKWVCSPRHHEPNAIRFVSNGHRERKL
jgi:hypothetical protein